VTAVTIFSRPGCHLCDDMKAVVVRVAQSVPLTIEEVDISLDPVLEARYGGDIPVLLIDGRRAAKYRVSESELLRILQGRTGGSGGTQEG
jgi:thiol-disulfide isomerase/thioredoxin